MKTIAKKSNEVQSDFGQFQNLVINVEQQVGLKGGGDGIIVEEIVVQ